MWPNGSSTQRIVLVRAVTVLGPRTSPSHTNAQRHRCSVVCALSTLRGGQHLSIAVVLI